MGKSGEKTRCGGTWTEARYFGFIRSALRKASMKYPVINEAFKIRRRPYTGTDKRVKWEYKCDMCGEWVQKKSYHMDHITPCGALNTYEDLPMFCATLFCELDNLRGLCIPCHMKVTHENE